VTTILLDSHAPFWFIDGDQRLSPSARDAIGDIGNVVYVSAVTAWEIASKFRLGKWPGAQALASDLAGIMSINGFEPLPLSLEHARHAGVLHTAPGPVRPYARGASRNRGRAAGDCRSGISSLQGADFVVIAGS
jgi:PIN domain nuclease of toxin-antitoxin system